VSTTCEKCGQATEYNGWPNYETWAVHLWLTNEEGSYNYWRELAAEAKKQAPAWANASGVFNKEQAARYHLADQLKDELEEGSPLAGTADLYTDLLGAAMSEVNWSRIAEAFLEE